MLTPKPSLKNIVALSQKKTVANVAKDKSGFPKTKRRQQENISIDVQQKKNLTSKIDLIHRRFKQLPNQPIPSNLKPMLASSLTEPFTDAAWLFEIKWDGYRALSYLNEGNVAIRSRNNLSFDDKFFPVHKALKNWPVNAVVDGEVVVLDEEGKPDFGNLQQWQRTGEGQLFYYLFDLLWLDGIDFTHEPLHKRKEILKQIMPDEGIIRYSDAIEEYGTQFFTAAKQGQLEGIVAKEKNSIYLPGYRTANWYKIKIEERHEAVICGYTKKADTIRIFSSLLLGIPTKEGLQFIGQVGTGFTEKSQREIFKKMSPLFTSTCPFEKKPRIVDPTLWVKPKLVCEVKYTELTKDGLMRHPSFQGLRIDKSIDDFNG